MGFPGALDARPTAGRNSLCDHPGCTGAGIHRAPKSRQRMNDYYWFCLDHVREYNRAWDYCAGMSAADIEAETRRAICWDRPTWRLGQWYRQDRPGKSRHDANLEFDDVFGIFSARPTGEGRRDRQAPPTAAATAERKALNQLGLEPGADWAEIRACYKRLAKRYHPDANGGDRQAEERLKEINQAYGVLKRRT
jgi:hypothetical protein